MDEREQVTRITALHARMNRMEVLMRQVLTMLAAGASTVERRRLEILLHELQRNPELPPEEPPELGAIRTALRAGDRLLAIKLYRSAFGASLQEAQVALDAL